MLGSAPARRRRLLTLTEGHRMLVGEARARLISWTESERRNQARGGSDAGDNAYTGQT